jgi:hypothetical protein
MGRHYVGSSLLLKDPALQNLTQYFERPRLVKRYTLTGGSRSVLDVFDVNANSLFNNTTGVFVSGFQRLTGVYGLRFKLKVRLQVAATPFHQGVIALGFQYYAASTGLTQVFNRCTLPQSITNLPHVRLDVSQSTMVELEVPFVHVNEFMTVDEGSFPYGCVGISTILPYETVVGLGAPTLEMYFSLHDMEFFGAEPLATTTITPQSGVEVENEVDARPFSSAAAAASRSVRFLARGIPSISSIAMPAAWFLDATAGALRAFGYSRPNVKDPVAYFMPSCNVREINTDIPTPAIMLSPKADNHIETAPFGGHDVDDMALSYVTSQWGQICVGNLTTSLAHGAALYATQVSPSCFWFRTPVGAPYGNARAPVGAGATKNCFFPSHLFHFGQMFRMWRGSVRFRFTFSKTKMHGGRLLCSFNPSAAWLKNSDGTVPTVPGPEVAGGLTQPFGHSMIFDLRDNNVFEFEVPYVAATPYQQFWSSIGGLSIVVVDPLVASATVSNTVGFLVEVCGGSDFEYAVPASPVYPSMGNFSSGALVVQSGLPTSATSSSVSRLTIGEKVMSVKQLIMLPKWTDTTSVPTSTVASQQIPPWYYHRNPPITAPFPAGTTFPEAFGIASNIAVCYTWAKGSTEVHAYCSASGGRNLMGIRHSVFDNAQPWVNASGLVGFRSRCSDPFVWTQDQHLHVRMPSYQSVVRIPAATFNNCDYSMTFPSIPLTPIDSSIVTILPEFAFRNISGSGAYLKLGRAAGDDAALSMYIGPCPLALLQAGAVTAFPDPDLTT